MIIWCWLYTHFFYKYIFILLHRFYFCEILLMASRVFSSSVIFFGRSQMILSRVFLSYHICTREAMSWISFGSIFPDFCETFVKSIDHLSSTIIFWAVFFPIQGTLERTISSSDSMALYIASSQSPSIAIAVFHHIPLTFRSVRKRDRSRGLENPKRVWLTSVIWWCTHTSIVSPIWYLWSDGAINTSKPILPVLIV